MTIQDDETLQMYLEESLEHLANIENDFLAIEEAGANINEDLVNKVYRAAHSIKGGAGFMGLTNIKDLTHEMENILGKIRSRELVPTTQIVNTLLDASDALKGLMGDVLKSNEADISSHIQALKAVLDDANHPSVGQVSATGGPAPAADPKPVEPATSPQASLQSPVASNPLDIALPDGQLAFTMQKHEIVQVMQEGKYIYLAIVDLIQDIKDKGKSLQGLVEEMEQTGVILNSNVDLAKAADPAKNQEVGTQIFMVLFATILKPEDVNVLFEIDESKLFVLSPQMTLSALGTRPAHESPSPEGGNAVDHAQAEPIAQPSVPLAEQKQPIPTMTDQAGHASEGSAEDSTASAPALPDDANASESSDNASAKASAGPPKSSGLMEGDTSLRVHVSLLDQLMTLAGELVLSRNQLLQSIASEDQRASEIAGQRIDLITSELQEAIMLTRMQSIGNVFNKFPRVVRDLARTLGKKVELTLEGKDVELDKTIIEAISDPLTHLIRNAVDHGVESPSVRQKAGKPVVGQIFLKAYHEAGQVNIEISDDGKGLDGRKLAEKAVEKGQITEEQAKLMSEKEKMNLIFLPGFSTAEKITDVSGRGVGMDVVKTNLDKLGGLIDIESEKGKGTTIRIKLPLTLAIIPCQIVLTGGERYAIPQVNLEELLRIPADQVKDRIERVGNAEVVRLRGNLLPLIKLAHVIGIQSTYIDPQTGTSKLDRRKSLSDRRGKQSKLFESEAIENEASSPQPDPDEKQARQTTDRRYHAASALNIVVVSNGAMKYGLVVDELHDSEEIVVKPLGRDLKHCKGYAGATIMGDGRVALILDVSNLAQMAGLVSMEGSVRAAELAREAQEYKKALKDSQSLLIFRSAEDEQFAAPLNLVERIEKVKAQDIETVGGKRVMKYRGGSLPLFSIDEVATVRPLAESENLLVIVFVVANREIGLLAIGPVDALECSLDVDGSTLKQTGIMGSMIINDHTTQLVDVYQIVQTLNPSWFETEAVAESSEGNGPMILFAEDSKFFRNQVKGSMEEQGYTVLEAEDGDIAWKMLQDQGDQIRIVVTDIEMPNMNGFELTKRIKGHPAFSHLPVIALTTLAGDEDVQRGHEVGIDDYQIKLDREKLLKSISTHLKGN
jgi:two-component system chemotaxis sensor kinase CheA